MNRPFDLPPNNLTLQSRRAFKGSLCCCCEREDFEAHTALSLIPQQFLRNLTPRPGGHYNQWRVVLYEMQLKQDLS